MCFFRPVSRADLRLLLKLPLTCGFIRWLALAVTGYERLCDGPSTAQRAIRAVTP